MQKPTDLVEWAATTTNGAIYGQPNKIEPTVEKIAVGFDEGEVPSRNHLNWLINNMHQWIGFLDQFVKLGTGNPNGSVVGDIGNIYINTSGGAGTTLYVKESGTATTTGWVAK